jgi:YHS domain-containing protein
MNDDKTDAPHKIEEEQAPVVGLEKEQNEAATEISTGNKNGTLSMDVKVHSPFKNYYEGKAFSISSENLTGPFDVLPRHHNFITLLSACELIIRTNEGEQKIEIAGGIMYVKADKVVVFLDI